MNWKPGDMARVRRAECSIDGEVVTIIGPLELCHHHRNGISVGIAAVYPVEYNGSIFGPYGMPWGFQPQHLVPIDDGNEKTTWDECVWKPKELVHVDL